MKMVRVVDVDGMRGWKLWIVERCGKKSYVSAKGPAGEIVTLTDAKLEVSCAVAIPVGIVNQMLEIWRSFHVVTGATDE